MSQHSRWRRWWRWRCTAARADLCNFCSPPAPVKLKKPLQTIIAAPLGSDLQSCSAHEVHSHSHSRIKRIFPVLITNTSGSESLFVELMSDDITRPSRVQSGVWWCQGAWEYWSVGVCCSALRWWRSDLMSVVMFGCQHFVCLTLGTRPDWLFIVNIMLIIAGLKIHSDP